MDLSFIEKNIKRIKMLTYSIFILVAIIVFLGVKIYIQSNTIDKLSLSLTAKESELYACKTQKVLFSSALDAQTREVEKNKIDLKKAREDLATVKPQIITRYRTKELDVNATCEAKLAKIEKTMEVYHANR